MTEPEHIDPSQLRPGPIRHASLPSELLEPIQAAFEIVGPYLDPNGNVPEPKLLGALIAISTGMVDRAALSLAQRLLMRAWSGCLADRLVQFFVMHSQIQLGLFHRHFWRYGWQRMYSCQSALITNPVAVEALGIL
ncbi:MAG: hypothetical protein HY000_38295 [Planctomycetes bacterium]|nr:hypothetical protein [Planctomycetota bacterium]